MRYVCVFERGETKLPLGSSETASALHKPVCRSLGRGSEPALVLVVLS